MSETTDAVLDTIEGQLDDIEEGFEIVEVVRNNPKLLIAVGVAGCAVGGVVGYFVAVKKLKAKYEELVTKEIAEAKEFYASLNKVDVDGAVLSPQEVFDQRHGSGAAAEALRTYQGIKDDQSGDEQLAGEPYDDVRDEEHIRRMEASVSKLPTPEEIDQEATEVNVFVDVTFDLEEEKKYRTAEAPYIITHDEFFEGEKNYETVELIYYEMDDTLVDEQDKPIEHTDAVVGDDHLIRFGAGSKDKNVVYVRNERLEFDYSISKSQGSYLEEVLGMPEEPDPVKISGDRAARRADRHGDG